MEDDGRSENSTATPQGARTNQVRRYTTRFLASASHGAKPRLGGYQRSFLGAHPISLTSPYIVSTPVNRSPAQSARAEDAG